MSLIPILALYTQLQNTSSKGSKSKNSKTSKTVEAKASKRPLTPEEVLKKHKDYKAFFETELGLLVTEELANNKGVFDILEKLVTGSDSFIRKDIKRGDEYLKSLVPQCDEFFKASETIKNMGFNITTEKLQNKYYVMNTTQPNQSFSYNYMPKETALNGIMLTAEQVRNGENPYAERLEEFRQAHPNMHEQLEQAQILVDKLSKNKISLKISNKKREELKNAQQRLKELKSVCEIEKSYIAQSNLYENLSLEQKEVLVDYLTKRETFENLCETITKTRSNILMKEGYVDPSLEAQAERKEYLSSILTSQIKSNLTEEEVKNLKDFISKVATQICQTEKFEPERFNGSKLKVPLTTGSDLVMKRLCAQVQKEAKAILEMNKTKQTTSKKTKTTNDKKETLLI